MVWGGVNIVGLVEDSRANGGWGYVSDEVWYVSSARNLLREFYGAYSASEYATVSALNLEGYRHFTAQAEKSGVKVTPYLKTLDSSTVSSWVVEAGNLAGFEGLPGVRVQVGYPYPDKDGIMEYTNLEHPPLVKYVLMGVLKVRDSPLAWKIPSLTLGASVLVLVWLVALRLTGSPSLSLIAPFLLLWDGSFRAMSLVAMLEIYLAFFTLLALYFAVSGWLNRSAVSLGLAASCKVSALFCLPAFLLAFRSRKVQLLLAIPIVALVYANLAAPVVSHLGGLPNWLSQLFWNLSYHTAKKGGFAPQTTPLGLLLGLNSFNIAAGFPAAANPALTLTAAASTLLLAHPKTRGNPGFPTVLAWFWSAYLGYALIGVLGGTLYTFYAAMFTPIAAILTSNLIFLLIGGIREASPV